MLVARHPDQEQLETWRRGVVLDNGYHTAPVKVRLEKFQRQGGLFESHHARGTSAPDTGSRLTPRSPSRQDLPYPHQQSAVWLSTTPPMAKIGSKRD